MALSRASTSSIHAHLAGGGIASLATAVFLIRDAAVPGQHIHIYEQLPVTGGSMDGLTSPVQAGYVSRGGRMFEDEAYQCLWNLLKSIPTLTDPARTVYGEFQAFNAAHKTHSNARIIDQHHQIVDAADLGFNLRDRAELLRLIATPEHLIGARRIEDFFSEHFFQTNFWTMWRTMFAFQNWHSAIEMRRYVLRFTQEFPKIHTLAGVRRSRLNQYDSVIRPIEEWLRQQGVQFEPGVTVVDADFAQLEGIRRITALHLEKDQQRQTLALGPQDYAFLTLGSMTSDSTYGTDDSVPELIRDRRDGGFRLWENIASKAPDFGRPNTFDGNIDESKWKSFTLTLHRPELLDAIVRMSGNEPGTGGLMTFRVSRWLLSIVVPHQPHFEGQPEDVFTIWGYSLFSDTVGDYIDKTMAQATGQEILTELLGHLGIDDSDGEIHRSTRVTTVMMPYITSQFARRKPEDRPLVVPKGSANFAFLGQYVEVPEDVVFTVEYSVRGAMHAVYQLFDIDQPIPGIYHAPLHPDVALKSLKTFLTAQGDSAAV